MTVLPRARGEREPLVYLVDDSVRIELGAELSRGRQGVIYEVRDEQSLAAKVFAEGFRSFDRVISHLSVDPRSWFDADGVPKLAWPIACLTEGGSECMGFLMVRLGPPWRQLDDMLCSGDRVEAGVVHTWRDLVMIALGLAELVDYVNARGWIVGDLSPTNVMVHDDGRVGLVDCDDMVSVGDPQDYDLRPLTTDRYGALELHRSVPERFSSQTDAWALGMMIVQLLQDGVHPFAGPGTDHDRPVGLLRNIEDGRTRFAVDGLSSAPSSPWLPIETLPPTILDLARRCLVEGRLMPESRPAPGEWARELRAIGYRRCSEHPDHVFSDHLVTCPWCEYVRSGYPDPFRDEHGELR
jgi:DNA-binding helix-hairpin-helix protein with protein kinase domain